MSAALSAAVRAAGSVRAPAGLKSWAAVWYIPMYLKCAASIRKNTTGFAFGVGLERIALLKYEIDDMRLLYENDTILRQFASNADFMI